MRQHVMNMTNETFMKQTNYTHVIEIYNKRVDLHFRIYIVDRIHI